MFVVMSFTFEVSANWCFLFIFRTVALRPYILFSKGPGGFSYIMLVIKYMTLLGSHVTCFGKFTDLCDFLVMLHVISVFLFISGQ